MRIEYFHASKYGNGIMVAQEFKEQISRKGVSVNIHHIKDIGPKMIHSAELYLFSSPGRMGGPTWGMRRFLKKVKLPEGTKYAILTTELAPQPDKRTGKMPSEEGLGDCQRIILRMNEILRKRGLIRIAEGKIIVAGLKGPLEEGWQTKVTEFVKTISTIMERGKQEDSR